MTRLPRRTPGQGGVEPDDGQRDAALERLDDWAGARVDPCLECDGEGCDLCDGSGDAPSPNRPGYRA